MRLFNNQQHKHTNSNGKNAVQSARTAVCRFLKNSFLFYLLGFGCTWGQTLVLQLIKVASCGMRCVRHMV